MIARVVAGLGILTLLAGCGVTIPTDPEDTLEDVRGGVLRVGVSTDPPWTEEAPDPGGSGPAGIEPQLVRDFAASLGAEVEWTRGGEADLVDQLHRDELDLVVGGLTTTSPWAAHATLTYPYAEATGPEGATELHVMAVQTGENAFLVELERFLLGQEVSP
ncbi:transporter substrate-binding domain-containing protein [Actinotalea solisilvae]|uniref:transporter substrate-binding domain-containing protein n=1 Tax=Actinotalea solisilvae TaxID=2072922 RepID=UPI0018F1D8E2|nr:transporter substrate-binding domain-containing protein [Actinotalea solisilvae]